MPKIQYHGIFLFIEKPDYATQLPACLNSKKIETKVKISDSRQTEVLGVESVKKRKSKKVEFGDKFETDTKE